MPSTATLVEAVSRSVVEPNASLPVTRASFDQWMVPCYAPAEFVPVRGLGSRVLELGGESGRDRKPVVYPGSYVEYVAQLGHEAPGIYT